MKLTLQDVAIGAVRLAAMSHFGPLAGGLFLAGGAVAGKILAETESSKAIADMAMHLAAGTSEKLFDAAREGFRTRRNEDIESSMQRAAQDALDELQTDAPSGFDGWFDAWRKYLTINPAAEVFAGVNDLSPVALEYDDTQLRELWWKQMEPVLVGWRKTKESSITQMHLRSVDALPAPLAQFLRTRLPEAMQRAHERVLRDKALRRSWIAFLQHIVRDLLNHALAMRADLAVLREGQERLIAGQVEIKDLLSGQSQVIAEDTVARIDGRTPQTLTSENLQLWTAYAKTFLDFYEAPPSPAYAYGRLQNSISLRGTLHNTVSIPLLPMLSKRFAAGKRAKPVILVGEYGQGKTAACGALGAVLAREFLSDSNHNPVPLIVPLGELRDVQLIDQHIQLLLANCYGLDPDISFNAFRQCGRFLILLDSLDEYFQGHSKADVVFHLRRFALHTTLRSNQFLVSSRPNIFGPRDRKDLSDLYDFVDIEWLAAADVCNYLTDLRLHEMMNDRKTIDALKEIAIRPLFLDMLSEAVRTLGTERITTNEASFLAYYIEAWHQRDKREKGNTRGTLGKEEILSVLGQAAASMNSHDSESVGLDELDSLVADDSRHFWREELSRLQTEARDRLLLVPHSEADGRRLTFRHACFRSYFVARHLADAIADGDRSALKNVKAEDLVVHLLFQMADRDKRIKDNLDNWSSAMPEALDWNSDGSVAILSMWAVRIGRTLVPHHLRGLFKFLGRGAGKIILDLMRQLGPRQLEGIEISNVDLRGILVPKLIFKDCHISGVNMDGSAIAAASFTSSTIESCTFRHAHLTDSTFKGVSVGVRSDFTQANLSCSKLSDTTITESDFLRTGFSEATALRVNFINCDLTSADFRLSLLEDCIFSNCRLRGALFVGSLLRGCQFPESETEGAFGFKEALAT
jgi:uncharacterized protein YjbI with pentapeptide repeats